MDFMIGRSIPVLRFKTKLHEKKEKKKKNRSMMKTVLCNCLTFSWQDFEIVWHFRNTILDYKA
jgi:hypothetical protein